MDPHQVSGVVIDIAGTGPSGTGRGIVPGAFQSAVVDVGDDQHGALLRVAVVRGIEGRSFCCRPTLYGFRHAKHDTSISGGLIPFLGNVRNIPAMPGLSGNELIIF